MLCYPNWVLDVTGPRLMFVPIDEEGRVILPLAVPECPGELVGIYHAGGPKPAEDWIRTNKDWYFKYKRQTDL